MMMEEETIHRLPTDVLAEVVSRAAAGRPRAACTAATVSPAFRAAADSDAVWSRFFPADLAPLACPSPAGPAGSPPLSKKELFLRLSGTHALLPDGLTSAWLDRESGAKSYMITARAMMITHVDNPLYWTWVPREDSRFPACAELLYVCWLDIMGRIETRMLTGGTRYAAYLVFKMSDHFYGLDSPLQLASIVVGEDIASTYPVRIQSLEDYEEDGGAQEEEEEEEEEAAAAAAAAEAARLPQQRPDGWMELELGDWENEGGRDGVVCARLQETRIGGNWKKGIIVEGIEIRPKN